MLGALSSLCVPDINRISVPYRNFALVPFCLVCVPGRKAESEGRRGQGVPIDTWAPASPGLFPSVRGDGRMRVQVDEMGLAAWLRALAAEMTESLARGYNLNA